jgi:hypothetical protein
VQKRTQLQDLPRVQGDRNVFGCERPWSLVVLRQPARRGEVGRGEATGRRSQAIRTSLVHTAHWLRRRRRIACFNQRTWSMRNVRSGSWLCENAKPLKDDRRNYSSKTALGLLFASAFNLEIKLENVILVAFRLSAFLHSQGHSRHFGRQPTTSGTSSGPVSMSQAS